MSIVIKGIGTAIEVVAELGNEPPRTAGYARWRAESRPRHRPLSVYEGQDEFTMTLPLVIDRFDEGVSIEADLLAVERLARPASENAEPPKILIVGPVPYASLTWVIKGIEFGDVEFAASRPNVRVRQFFVLTLGEYVPPDQLNDPKITPAQKTRKKATPKQRRSKQRRYIAKAGDDLTTIAAWTLGDWRRWREIAKINDVKDPRRKLHAGDVIRMP